MIDISIELIGLLIVVLTQIVLVATTIKDLKNRVAYLEIEVKELTNSKDTLIAVKTKLDMISEVILKRRATD